MNTAKTILNQNTTTEYMLSAASQLCRKTYRDNGHVVFVFDDNSELTTEDLFPQ